MQYYIIHNNRQFGPMEIAELINYGLSPDSMVWAEGMSEWVPASSVEEICSFIRSRQVEEESKFYIIKNNQQFGPFSIAELRLQNITPDTLVWKEGMSEWKTANTQFELNDLFRSTTPPPYCSNANEQSMNPASPPSEYDYYLSRNINDLRTWSIVMIIFGFLLSCLGGIFAIVAYTKVSNARDSFAREHYTQAEESYSSAKIWFIISCVITGLGLIGNISFL